MARLLGGDRQSLKDAELSVDLLQRTYPQVLSSWVSVGIYAMFLGYGASVIGIYLQHSAGALLTRADPWMLLVSVTALVLHRRGRARAAAVLLLGSVWLEQHLTLATMPQQV
jgi:hypothetical protein